MVAQKCIYTNVALEKSYDTNAIHLKTIGGGEVTKWKISSAVEASFIKVSLKTKAKEQ